MRNIKEIIIHCSATPEGRNNTINDIRKWHKARGYNDIGYHYVIHLDGSVNTGRNLARQGAHCIAHNANSIGICYVGGLAIDGITPKDTRNEEQKAALIRLLKNLHARFPRATIHGHNEFAAKACPSFNVHEDKEIIEIFKK